MRISFLEIAALELEEAVHFYNKELPGLGELFLKEVLRCLERIAKYPDSCPFCSPRTQRCLTRRFPYGIIYQVRGEEILVVAVANLHRKPDYWRDRL